MNVAAQPGPGKYGPQAERVLLETGAAAVFVCVLEGMHGSSFDCCSLESVRERFASDIPSLLRRMADQIEGAAHKG